MGQFPGNRGQGFESLISTIVHCSFGYGGQKFFDILEKKLVKLINSRK
jgi:hypothetical protein